MAKITSNKNNGYVELTLEVSGNDWKVLLQKAEKTLFANFELKGFRKGQVPINIAKTHISSEKIRNEAVDLLLEQKNHDLMEELNKEDIASRPTIHINKISDDEVSLMIKSILAPTIKIGDLSKLTAKLEINEPTEKEVEEEVKKLNDFLKEKEELKGDAKLENGMTANISFVGKVDGKEFEGGKSDSHDLKIGSKSFIDNFEDQLIGLKVGDKKLVTVTFPKAYPVPELADKPATFDVEIKKIFSEKPIEGEALKAKLKMFGFNSKEHMLEMIKNLLKEQKADNARNKFFTEVTKQISELSDSKIELNDELIKEEIQSHLKEVEQKLSQQGMGLEDYLKMINTSMEDFLEKEVKTQAKQKVISSLIFHELIKQFDIKVTEEDFETEYQKLAQAQNIKIDEVKKQIEKENLRGSLMFIKLIARLSNK